MLSKAKVIVIVASAINGCTCLGFSGSAHILYGCTCLGFSGSAASNESVTYLAAVHIDRLIINSQAHPAVNKQTSMFVFMLKRGNTNGRRRLGTVDIRSKIACFVTSILVPYL